MANAPADPPFRIVAHKGTRLLPPDCNSVEGGAQVAPVTRQVSPSTSEWSGRSGRVRTPSVLRSPVPSLLSTSDAPGGEIADKYPAHAGPTDNRQLREC